MSYSSLYWGRIAGAAVALFLAVTYMAGFIELALFGFGIVALVGGAIGYRLNRGSLVATCDLCGGKGMFRAEYGHGFRNARIILDCPGCGRVVNRAGHGVSIEREQVKEQP